MRQYHTRFCLLITAITVISDEVAMDIDRPCFFLQHHCLFRMACYLKRNLPPEGMVVCIKLCNADYICKARETKIREL